MCHKGWLRARKGQPVGHRPRVCPNHDCAVNQILSPTNGQLAEDILKKIRSAVLVSKDTSSSPFLPSQSSGVITNVQ